MPRANLSAASVIAAAADLADRDGFDAVSISAVARGFGVQPASLYSHVRDRAALVDGMMILALDDIATAVSAEIEGRAGRDALAGLARAQRDIARERPGLWSALRRPASPATAASPGAARLVASTFAVLRGYRIPDEELVHATRFVAATVNGFLSLERDGSFEHRDERTDVSWERAVDALDRALTSWTSVGNGDHS